MLLIKNVSDIVSTVTLPHKTVTLLPGQSEPIIDLFHLDKIKEVVANFEGNIILMESEEGVELALDPEIQLTDALATPYLKEDPIEKEIETITQLANTPLVEDPGSLLTESEPGVAVLDELPEDDNLGKGEEKEERTLNSTAINNIFNSEKLDKTQKRDILKKIATHLKLDFNANIPTEKLYNLIIS